MENVTMGCVFCGRNVRTKRHHLIPKSKGGKVMVPTCYDCEDFIHRNFTHTQLRDDFNTVAKMQANEAYQTFVTWLLKQQPGASFSSRRNRNRGSDSRNRRYRR